MKEILYDLKDCHEVIMNFLECYGLPFELKDFLEVDMNNGPGIRDPRFETLRIEIVRTDRGKNPHQGQSESLKSQLDLRASFEIPNIQSLALCFAISVVCLLQRGFVDQHHGLDNT